MPQPTDDTAAVWSLRRTSNILGHTTGIVKARSTDEGENDDEAFKGVIHKTILCCYSRYYRAALQGAFAEASSKSIVLDLDPVSCNTLVGWLYSGQLPAGGRREQFFALCVFADKTDMLALRRAIMTRVVGTEGDCLALPIFEKAALALDSLPQTSPLYRWLLDTYIRHWLPEYKAPEDVLPNGFLVDWVRGAAARSCEVMAGDCEKCPCCKFNACNYHEHESIEEWTSTCFAGKAKRPDDDSLSKNAGPKIVRQN